MTETHKSQIMDEPERLEKILAGLERTFAPLLKERFPKPIRLTRDADKGDEVLYAIGRGPAGLVVELHDSFEVYSPAALASFATHRHSLFETLDPEALASVAPLLPSGS